LETQGIKPTMDVGEKLTEYYVKKSSAKKLPSYSDQLDAINNETFSNAEADSILWFCNKFTLHSDPKNATTNSNKRSKVDFLEKVKRSLIARRRGVPVSQIDNDGNIIKKNDKGEQIVSTEKKVSGKEGKEEETGEAKKPIVDMVEETKRFLTFTTLLARVNPELHQWSLLLAQEEVEVRANFWFDVAYSNITGKAKESELSVRLIKYSLMPGVLRACSAGRIGALLEMYVQLFKNVTDENKKLKYNSQLPVESAPLGALSVCFVNLKEVTNRHEFKLVGNVSKSTNVVTSSTLSDEALRNCILLVMSFKNLLEQINQFIPKFFTKQTVPTGLVVSTTDSLETKLWKETIVGWNTFKVGKESKSYWHQGSKVRNFGSSVQVATLNQFVEVYDKNMEKKKKEEDEKKEKEKLISQKPPTSSTAKTVEKPGFEGIE